MAEWSKPACECHLAEYSMDMARYCYGYGSISASGIHEYIIIIFVQFTVIDIHTHLCTIHNYWHSCSMIYSNHFQITILFANLETDIGCSFWHFLLYRLDYKYEKNMCCMRWYLRRSLTFWSLGMKWNGRMMQSCLWMSFHHIRFCI